MNTSDIIKSTFALHGKEFSSSFSKNNNSFTVAVANCGYTLSATFGIVNPGKSIKVVLNDTVLFNINDLAIVDYYNIGKINTVVILKNLGMYLGYVLLALLHSTYDYDTNRRYLSSKEESLINVDFKSNVTILFKVMIQNGFVEFVRGDDVIYRANHDNRTDHKILIKKYINMLVHTISERLFHMYNEIESGYMPV